MQTKIIWQQNSQKADNTDNLAFISQWWSSLANKDVSFAQRLIPADGALDKINWDNLLNEKCINKNINLFYNILYEIINKHVPKFINKKKLKFPVWFNTELKQCIFLKNLFMQNFKF